MRSKSEDFLKFFHTLRSLKLPCVKVHRLHLYDSGFNILCPMSNNAFNLPLFALYTNRSFIIFSNLRLKLSGSALSHPPERVHWLEQDRSLLL